MFENGDYTEIAPADQVTPHLEVKFARDEFDRASLENAITARIGGKSIPIGPLELQIAYLFQRESPALQGGRESRMLSGTCHDHG